MWTREDIESLYQQHGFSVFRRCRRLLGEEEDARDMAQQVFLKALENPDAFRGQSSVATYLYAVATNLCLNKIRDSKARSSAWQQRVGHYINGSSKPDDPHAKTATRIAVQAILDEMDETTRAIAVYHHVDGLTQGEIAKLVGLSRVSINQKLKKLRESWQQRKEDVV